MSFIITDRSTDFKPVPKGTHLAICTLVVNMGVQPSKFYEPQAKTYLGFELPNERLLWRDSKGFEHSGPMRIGQQYTKSLSPKSNLRKDLESWRGSAFTKEELAGFDYSDFLGKACMLTIAHHETEKKTYANIIAVAPVPPETTDPAPSAKLIAYDADDADDAEDPETFEALPKWLKAAIKNRVTEAAPESTAPMGEAAAVPQPPFDDVIPF